MLPSVVRGYGLALSPLLAGAGISAGDDLALGQVVRRAQVSTLLQEAARRAGEPMFGLELAASADPAQLGLTGHVLSAGLTLRECLAAQARHMPAFQGGVRITLDEANGRAVWHHGFADSDPDHARVLNEGVVGFMVAMIRAISGCQGDCLHVSLPHRPQIAIRHYEDKLGAPISFGVGSGISVALDASLLDRPNRLLGPEKLSMGGEMSVLDEEAARLGGDALVETLFLIFERAALAGSLSLIEAARSIGFAPRSLQRQLSILGLSFEAVVDAWRRGQAQHHLANPLLPVGSIARALGYSHPAHFVRAFRRWEGVSPMAFRRALPGGVLAPNGN
jgi:AraC-like DNA-binding protein